MKLQDTGRRTLLKTVGAATVASTAIVGNTSANAQKERYRGFTYDPKTYRILGDASARAVHNKNGIRGTLHLSNITIPFSAPQPYGQIKDQLTLRRFKTVTTRKKGDPDKEKNQFAVQITAGESGGINGQVLNLGYGEKAYFNLANISRGYAKGDVERGLDKADSMING